MIRTTKHQEYNSIYFNAMNQSGSSFNTVKLFISCLLAILITIPSVVSANPRSNERYIFSQEPKKLALVIGNADYQKFERLPGSTKDSDRITETLTQLGFDVKHYDNIKTFSDFVNFKFVPFANQIEEGDIVVLYFSGHGFAYGQSNYLVPTDAPTSVSKFDLDSTFVPERALRSYIAGRKPGALMVFLDACRTYAGLVQEDNQPGPVKGFAEPRSVGSDFVIGFAAEPGQAAFGSKTGDLSWYTRALVRHLPEEALELSQVKKRISHAVRTETEDKQKPWFSESITTDIYLRPTTDQNAQLLELWKAVVFEGNHDRVVDFLAFNKVSPFAAAARKWLKENKKNSRIVWSRVFPIVPELMWDQGGNVSFPKLPSAVAVERTTELQIDPTMLNAISVDDLSSLIKTQRSAILVEDGVYQSNGQPLKIEAYSPARFASSDVGRVSIKIKRNEGQQDPSLLETQLLAYGNSAGEIGVGRPIAEVVTQLGSSALSDTVSSLKQSGRNITWVSISTPNLEDENQRRRNNLEATRLKYQLNQNHGVRLSKISTVHGLAFQEQAPRIRIYGY